MKKRIVSLLLAALMLATLLPVQAWGATVVDSGYCGGEGDGKNLTWSLDSDGLLTISGTGEMLDFIDHNYDRISTPWNSVKSSIKQVSIETGVTSIGDHAFKNCTNLTNITISDSVTSIGIRVFESCSSLKSLVIPNGVTAINMYTFLHCTDLTSITIPDSITSIGFGAFYDCKKLESFTIPSGVTSIGNVAFCGCNSLSGVIVIPRGVVKIGNSTFAYCYNLSGIIIPDSVTYIDWYAFRYCRSLTTITIPDTVKFIGGVAFESCSRLTSIAIPDGITTIGEAMFIECQSLTSVAIPASVTTIDRWAFGNCSNLTDVYYAGSEKQWQNISISRSVAYDGANNDDLISATIHYNVNRSAESTIYNATTNELALTVYENKNTSNIRETDYRLSSGAAVSSGSVNGVTDKNGQISQPYSGGAVTVSKNGYVSRTISEAALKTNPTVWLQKESDSYPVISAVWMNDVKDIMNAEYFLPLVQDTSHKVRAEVNWGGSSMKSLILAQGTTTVNISDSHNTDIKWSDQFDLSREILVVATNAAGKTSSRALKLKAGSEATQRLDGFQLDFSDSLKFTIPDSVPGIGGESMKIGLYSPVGIDYVVENGKIYVAIGGNFDSSTNKEDGTKIKSFVDSVKSFQKNAKKLSDMFRGKTKVKGSWGIDAGFNFAGYAEGYFDENYKIHWLDTGLLIGVEGGLDFTSQFTIGPVPAYLEAGLKAKLELDAALFVSEAAKKFTPDGTISGSLGINVGIGAGVKKALSFGGGVEGKLSPEMQFKNAAVSSAVAKLSFGGYLKATFIGLEYKHDFDPWVDKVFWEYPDYSSHADTYSLEDDFYESAYDTGSYSQPDLGYLASGSPFLANGSSGGMMRALRAVTVDSASTFQSNTYQNAAPQLLCLSDGTMMAVWTGYDSSRSGMNALCLYYARYDGSSWSESAVLDNDGTLDCGFTLREINGAPCVVWENASGAIESSDDLDAVAAKMSISVARYVDGAFVVECVSNAEGVDMMPDVCAVNDGLAVVWLRNESGDLFANDGTNKIVCRTMTGEGWSEESVLYSGLNSADSLAVGSSGDTLQVAYGMDTDGDLTTSADMEVYINGSAATSDSVIDSGVQYENGQFYWYKDGALMSGGNEMVSAASNLRSDRYQVVESSGVKAVLFTQSNGVYSSLYGIFCDTTSGTWGEPVALTDGSDYIQAFSTTPSANGLQVMVNRLAVTGDGSTGDPYGEARMDILDLTLGCDLAVKDVYCDMQYYVAGNKLPVTVTVANKGRQAVSQVKVTFLAENGTELGTETLDISLPAGVTQEIETGFTVKDVVQGQKITVQVTPVDNTDINTADNAAELTLQQHDIALENMSWGVNSSGQAVIYADVVNRGYTASGTLTVSLRKGSETGDIVSSAKVDSLDTLGLQRVSFETAYEEGVVYYLTLDECEDDSIANNSDFVVLRKETTTTGKTVSGTLQAAGLPQGETIRITLSQGDAVCYELSAGEGSFSFTDVEPGSYIMTLYHEGFVSHSYDLTVDGNLLNLTAQIVQRGNVNGATTYGKAIDASDVQCLYEILTIGKYDSSCIADKDYLNDVADVNMDGTVDVYDLQLLYETVSGIV